LTDGVADGAHEAACVVMTQIPNDKNPIAVTEAVPLIVPVVDPP